MDLEKLVDLKSLVKMSDVSVLRVGNGSKRCIGYGINFISTRAANPVFVRPFVCYFLFHNHCFIIFYFIMTVVDIFF